MLRLSHRLGNIHTDPALAAQVSTWQQHGGLDEVTIDEREARKSRLRVQTVKGREVGILLPRGTVLAAGDVFAVEGEEGGVLVHLALQEVMVLTPLLCVDTVEQLRRAVRLGHVLGNQHWPVAVVGEQVLVPVALDRAVMETVLRTHHLTEHFSIRYEQRPWPKEEALSDQHSAISRTGYKGLKAPCPVFAES
jgi:urease accessory protein